MSGTGADLTHDFIRTDEAGFLPVGRSRARWLDQPAQLRRTATDDRLADVRLDRILTAHDSPATLGQGLALLERFSSPPETAIAVSEAQRRPCPKPGGASASTSYPPCRAQWETISSARSPISHKRVAAMRPRNGPCLTSPPSTPLPGPRPRRPGEAVDVAARYFIYELYDATSGHAGAWKALRADVEPGTWRARSSADGRSSATTGKGAPRCGARRLLTRGGASRARASGDPPRYCACGQNEERPWSNTQSRHNSLGCRRP